MKNFHFFFFAGIVGLKMYVMSPIIFYAFIETRLLKRFATYILYLAIEYTQNV